jgi:penicillin amidase
LDGKLKLACLEAEVTVESDKYGNPIITAANRLDAYRTLGFLTARDRLFQMDLLRRSGAGQLAEVLGKGVLKRDISQRVYGFNRTARAINTLLPPAQREILEAYAEGVNGYISQMKLPPLECLILRYRVKEWSVEDSILVSLFTFQDLTGRAEEEERMVSLMRHFLPPTIVDFLTPAVDRFSILLLGENALKPNEIPLEAFAALRPAPTADGIQPQDYIKGSNGWVVSGEKTVDGRAILVNDLHLQHTMPNIWYRAVLQYGETVMAGLVLPGVPVMIVGSNRKVAWGFTNTGGDFLDLVELEINPDNPAEYRSGNNWKNFEVVKEQIQVKGADTVQLEVQISECGPVSNRPLLGKKVAIHWTALDPQCVNMGLLDMEYTRTVDEAVRVAQHSGLPPINVMLADAEGNIGWTLAGKFPVRNGFDGSSSLSWADGERGWRGYIPEYELPTVQNPPEGLLVTANNRTIGTNYKYAFGNNYASGYRAYRIRQCMENTETVSESQLFQLLLDTEVAEFYNFYRELALEIIEKTGQFRGDKETGQILREWDGRAEVDSAAIGLLVKFRESLLKVIIGSYLSTCSAADPSFKFYWGTMDLPLQKLLVARLPETLPSQAGFKDWDALLTETLAQTITQLKKQAGVRKLTSLKWGKLNQSQIAHPLSKAIPIPGINRLLNPPKVPLPGTRFSLRNQDPGFGATVRLVISPAHPENGLLQVPGGQSGQPLSPHYKDQHKGWVQGIPLPFMGTGIKHNLLLKPTSNATKDNSLSLKELEAAQAAQDWDKVIAISNEILRQVPEDKTVKGILAIAYRKQALLYFNQEEHTRSIASFDASLNLDSGYAPTYNNRANACMALGQLEEAIRGYDRAILLKPDYAFAYNNRGNFYYELENYAQAFKDFNRAITLDHNVAAVFNNRGRVYYKLKDFQSALADFDKAIELDKDFAFPYHNRGLVYQALNEPDKAHDNFMIAASLEK